jgi:plasmid stability protein
MGKLLVCNVDDGLIRRLRKRAAAPGHSAEAEHHLIVRQALGAGGEASAGQAARWRRLTAGRETTDSAELIRADRDRDHQP